MDFNWVIFARNDLIEIFYDLIENMKVESAVTRVTADFLVSGGIESA